MTTPKPKQNAPQSRLRPKVGQVWTIDGRICRTFGVEANAISFIRHDTPDSAIYTMRVAAWLADRKAGVIRIVRANK